MMTVREKLGTERKKVLLTWAWHPKPLPMAVPNSFALAAAQFGHDVRIAHPPGYELDPVLIRKVESHARKAGGSIEFVHSVSDAFDGVDVVYAKSWGSRTFYGSLEAETAFRADMRKSWIVDTEKMRKTNEAIFMHCLPVRRNVIVTDEVIDSARSVVIDEAENRLHVQKAILTELVK
jgi:N-acetylornithine carbamoyltransferase